MRHCYLIHNDINISELLAGVKREWEKGENSVKKDDFSRCTEKEKGSAVTEYLVYENCESVGLSNILDGEQGRSAVV